MSANSLPKRLLSLVLTFCMVLSLVPMSALATGDSSSDPDRVDNAIVNGSFEKPAQTSELAPQLNATTVPGWSTTATDHLIEFGVNIGRSSAPQLWGTDRSIPDGNQFAELNADETSTLYQNVRTVDGHIYEWGLSHRGREGTDTMALIIGPQQANAPAKPNKTGQDQFMRLTDWVKRNAETLGVTVPRDGCSQRITVYSKKFDENGGFLNNTGSESPFSTAPSNLYTETWSVWIIATGNQSWGSYGTHNRNYNPLKGIGGGIGCSYTVPAGQNETTFAFCSYAGATNNKTLGNLLDNITFSLYHNVTFTTTAGGQGTVGAEIQGTTKTVDFSDKNAINVPVRNKRKMTLTAPATAASGATFVGAYITQHSTSGSSTEFVDKSEWRANGTNYTYTGTVIAPTDVVLVFVQSPAVTYDANGGDRYVHTPGAQQPTDVVSFAADTRRTEYTSHAATASQQIGWVFDGWLLARAGKEERVLPAVHTVSYANGTFTFKDETGQTRAEIEADGVALLAQWRWQQTFQTQLQQGDTVTDTDACGTIKIKKDDSDVPVKTYDAATGEQVTVTANANEGYAFLGWYRTIDGQLQLVSQDPTYTYTVGRQGVQTVYARFAKTYTITYTWDESDNKPTDQTPPAQGTATAGTTYPLSQAFVPQQTTVSATVNGVPGHWLFQGWKEQGGTDYLGQEIANVTRNYDLVGSWSFIPNNRYRLTYDVGNHNTNWIPSGLGAVVQSNPLHYYQETVTSAAAPTIPEAEKTILAANGTNFQGTWEFQGWKRSDTGETVPVGERSFSMPNHDLTLTAQWEFTPNTYKVAYNLNNGMGDPPAGHDSYTYPEIQGKTGVDTSKSGIPFGASVQLRDFLGTPPTGKYFAGWGLTPNGPVAYEPEESVNNESLKVTTSRNTITLYAIYKDIGTVTVEFAENDANRGSVDVRQGSFSEINGTLSGDTVRSVATAKPGYHFTGWTCETSGKRTDAKTLKVTASQVQTLFKEHPNQRVFRFTAQFEPNSFTVRYNANGGEGTMGDLTYTHGQDQSLTKCGFTRSGYAFLGWATAADGKVAYHDQQSLSITQDTTLYAVWKQQPNQGGSGGGHHNSGGTQEKPDETPPTTLNDTDHYAYIVGYEDGTIRPNGHITRAEAATVFFRLLTDKARDANLTDRSPYPDVSAGDWYNKAIATLSRMGILSGYEDGSFRPNATVTRAEFAAMAARFDTEAKPVDTPFTDLTGCWAADEIAKAYGKGWVNGYGDNTFRPNGPITRAEAVTLINRVLRRLPETDKDLLPDERTWPDNPETFWGYLALQEASNSHLYDRKSDGYETQTKILPPRDWSQEFEQ